MPRRYSDDIVQRRLSQNMSFQYVQEIPSPQEILAAMPLSPELAEIKKKRDQEIKAAFTGESRQIRSDHRAVLGPR